MEGLLDDKQHFFLQRDDADTHLATIWASL